MRTDPLVYEAIPYVSPTLYDESRKQVRNE